MLKVIIILFLATTWAVSIKEQHAKYDSSAVHIQPRGTEQIVGNKLLAVGPFKATWFEADDACKFGGKTLATALTVLDQNNLENYLNIYGLETDVTYYIDANNLAEGHFIWTSTGLPVQQLPGSQYDFKCLSIANNRFFPAYYETGDCYEKKYFVCQKILNA